MWLGPLVLAVKVLILLCLCVGTRIGRPRYDQLMAFSWKFLLPVSLGYMIITVLLTVFFK